MSILPVSENMASQVRVTATQPIKGVRLATHSAATTLPRVERGDEDEMLALANHNKLNEDDGLSDDVEVDAQDDDDDDVDEPTTREPYDARFDSLTDEKEHYIQKIMQHNQRGIPSHRRLSLDSPLDEIKHEYARLRKQATLGQSIKFQRRILMATTSGTEFLNRRFNPVNVKLDGWSEQVLDSIEEYDDVFGDLHDKYSSSVELAPEWRLLMMVCGSAFMFHLSSALFKSALPSVATVAKQNPDLMKNISSAMAKAMAQNANANDDDEVDETDDDDDVEEEDDEDDEVETVGAMGEQLVMQQLAQSLRPTPPLQRAKNARIQETAPPQKRHKTAYSTTSSERAVDVRI